MANDSSGLADRLTAVLRDAGAALVGFGDLRGIEEAKLPTGIAVAVPVPADIVEGIRLAPTPAYAQAYRELNVKLNEIVLQGEKYLAEQGFNALALTKERVNETRIDRFRTRLPHKTVATRAGLGWIGKSCLLVTPEYGSAVRISSLLTDAPLPCAQPIAESHCGRCEQCRKNCPSGAIRGTLWLAGMRRSEIVDLDACVSHMEAVSRGMEEDLICGVCIAACPYTQRYLRREGA